LGGEFENLIQPGEAEQLADCWARPGKADDPAAGGDEFVDGDEGAETFGVDEGRARQVDFDELVVRSQGGTDQFAQERGLVGAEIRDTGYVQDITLGFGFHVGRGDLLAGDFEDSVHASEFEDLLDLGQRIPDSDVSTPCRHGLVEGDQGAQAGTVEESGFTELEVDSCVMVAQSGSGLIPEGSGIGGVQFGQARDAEHGLLWVDGHG